MKQKYIFYTLLVVVILFSFFSCPMRPKRQFIFDKATLEAQKAKWKALDLQNYFFKYGISYLKPGEVFGVVSVKNGIGSLDLMIRYGKEQVRKGHERYDDRVAYYSERYGSSIELYSIDDVFRLIERLAIHRKTAFDSGYIIDYEMFVKYDEKGIPISIMERVIEKNRPKGLVVGYRAAPSFGLWDFEIKTP